MQFLRALLPRPQSGIWDHPLPLFENPVCILGDLHGMAASLERMFDLIDQQPDVGRVRLVVVGDMIDRGPDSATVLTRLRGLETIFADQVICLMGNHERMLLDFLANPARSGMRWLGAGGAEMLASFGLGGRFAGDTPANRFERIAEDLRAALPQDMEQWLQDLPLYWEEGGLAVTHAGADPAQPLNIQNTELIWGHRDFQKHSRRDGLWVAHGHVIVKEPYTKDGRIAVDTGAYRTGLLSAAWLDQSGLRFLQVPA